MLAVLAREAPAGWPSRDMLLRSFRIGEVPELAERA